MRLAQHNLQQLEHGREHRIKILRKTHQSALSMKQVVIRELQDIIADKDEYINRLESKLAGKDVQIDGYEVLFVIVHVIAIAACTVCTMCMIEVMFRTQCFIQ